MECEIEPWYRSAVSALLFALLLTFIHTPHNVLTLFVRCLFRATVSDGFLFSCLCNPVFFQECGAGVHADAGFVQAAVESLCGVGEANEAARLLRLHFEHAGVPGAVPVPAFEVCGCG